jgi:tetratricopeptide (TPR) repeat protein
MQIIIVLCLLLLSGCATVSPQRFTIREEDEKFCKALAHFACGLLHEQEEGRFSASALAHYLQAIESDPLYELLYHKAALHQKSQQELYAILEKACSANPRSVRAHFECAYAYEVGGLLPKSAFYYHRATELSPSNTACWLSLARVLFADNRHKENIRIIGKSIKTVKEPTLMLSFALSAGSKLISEGDDTNARQYLDLVATHSPTNRGIILYRIGALYESYGYENDALNCYVRATKEPDVPSECFFRAGYLVKKNDCKKAENILKTGLSRYPDNLPLLFLLEETYVDCKRYKDALNVFNVIENAGRNQQAMLSPVFYIGYASVYERLGDEDMALEWMKKCCSRFDEIAKQINSIVNVYREPQTNSPPPGAELVHQAVLDKEAVLLVLGTIYLKEKRYTDAMEVFARLDEKNRESAQKIYSREFYLNYGSACERSGKMELAESIFHQCLKLYPDAHEVLNYLAYMWAEKGIKLDKALEYVLRALQLEPENGAYIDTLGWIYYQQKRYEDALKQLVKANDRLPNDPVITEHIGDVYLALNKIDEAISWWKQSYLLDTENKAVAGKLRKYGQDIKKLRHEAFSRARKKEQESSQPQKEEEVELNSQ